MIINLYFGSVLISFMIMMGIKQIVRDNASTVMSRLARVLDIPTDGEFNPNVSPLIIVFIPVANIILVLFALWFVVAADEKVEKFISFLEKCGGGQK